MTAAPKKRGGKMGERNCAGVAMSAAQGAMAGAVAGLAIGLEFM